MKRKLNLQKVRNVPFFIIFVVIMFLGLPLDITAEEMENLLSKQEKLQKFILACHYGVFIILFKNFRQQKAKDTGLLILKIWKVQSSAKKNSIKQN
jgi:hypothetical protein